VRWSRRRLARQLAGRRISAHLLTHAHFDHAGTSAWLCHTFDLPLWCGQGDADAITSGRVDTHGSPLVNRLQRTLAPVAAHPVARILGEGDLVAGYEVLEVPGHSPGALGSTPTRPTTVRPTVRTCAGVGSGRGSPAVGWSPRPDLGGTGGR
jgi:glyoxylase-like metal-dependent hydrolase (beta-lactamase superfamily II)